MTERDIDSNFALLMAQVETNKTLTDDNRTTIATGIYLLRDFLVNISRIADALEEIAAER